MKKVKEVINYCCMSCERQPWVDRETITKHLIDAHQVKITKSTKAQSRGILFLDGSGYFDNTFEVTFENGVIVHKHVRGVSPTVIKKPK